MMNMLPAYGMPHEALGVFEGFEHLHQPARVVTGGSRGSKAGIRGRGQGEMLFDDGDNRYTTVMLRNIPNKYTRQMLIEQLYRAGFRGDIDYLYLPTDFANRCNVGYCFTNFRTPAARQRFVGAFDGVAAQTCLPGFNSYKVCQVTKAKWQGREENVRRLRSSPELMGQLSAHPEWLPLLLDDIGESEPFICEEPSLAGLKGAKAAKGQGNKKGGGGGGKDSYTGLSPGLSELIAGIPPPGSEYGLANGAKGGFKGKGEKGFKGQGKGGGKAGGKGFGPHGVLGGRGRGMRGGMDSQMDPRHGAYAGMPMMHHGMPIMMQQGAYGMPYDFADAGYFMHPAYGMHPMVGAEQFYNVGGYGGFGAGGYGAFDGGYGDEEEDDGLEEI